MRALNPCQSQSVESPGTSIPLHLEHEHTPYSIPLPPPLYGSASVTSPPSLFPQVADGSRSTQQRPLEMFFPFDPYLLKRSSRHLHLRQSYVRWRHGHPSTHVAAAKGGSATGAAAAGGRSGAQGHEAHGDSDAGEDEDDSDEVSVCGGGSVPWETWKAPAILDPARALQRDDPPRSHLPHPVLICCPDVVGV